MEQTKIMAKLASLCVYCGSSTSVRPVYLEAAAELGQRAARRGIRIVFGGGRVGLMGAVADAALEAGGKVHGIIPRHLDDYEIGHRGTTELEIVESMHVRKMRMFEESDAFCILPGGFGTLDETFEMVTWVQLGLHEKPIVLVNVEGFWDPLLELVHHQIAENFVRPEHSGIIRVVDRVEQVFDAVAEVPDSRISPSAKWA
jgi:uncharacterized protein (TIGR00730 family)